MRLANKVALVTGGSRGIGRAIALGLAREGADVAVVFEKNVAAAEATVDSIRGLGRRAVAIQADVADSAQVRAAVGRALDALGGIDVLVNDAGITGHAAFLEMTEEQWDRMLAVDLKSVFLVSQAVAREMASRGGGAIVNVTSIRAHSAIPGLSHYQAAKAGVEMLTRSMALELAPHGIRVNAIEPGSVETDMARARPMAPEVREERLKRMPLGRFGQPEDLAGAAVFLASEESAYVTGSVIKVDGGQTLT